MTNTATVTLAAILALILIATGYAIHLTPITGTANLQITFNTDDARTTLAEAFPADAGIELPTRKKTITHNRH
jgi:hypothetical protein